MIARLGYFFRETAQFEALDNVRLDELCQGGRRGALRMGASVRYL